MTAEFAVILPAVAALAILVCALGRAIVLRIECQDAAHVIAQRIVAQMQADPAAGEVQPAVTQWAEETTHRLVNDGASVSLTVSDDGVDVRVSARVVPDPLRVLPATVTGYAFACVP
ncbi:TadE/TadG family type IV pilus assembly protein [Pseudoscardovia radai]|uniref:TadE/TadG family type IV pilus assembly protein n=1 Tax=Pseudoscardovia radai TaxID=987066 RepID=UPI0039941932